MQNSENRPPYALESILRALAPPDLARLTVRLGIRIDPAKRIDGASQAARALVGLIELRDDSRVVQASRELLHRVAEAGGALTVSSLPPSVEPLVARGLIFVRAAESCGFELIVPSAYLVQLRTWDGEDPRGIRSLLAQASFETTSAIAAHYLGRPATTPMALSLEQAWSVLSQPDSLAEELGNLPPTERKVLEAVDRDGGEVDTEELLAIEREPIRMRTASGPALSRRGVGFALERRGFLIPVHPNRHIIPTEVRAVVGAVDQAARARRRESIRGLVTSGDHAPHRAKFSMPAAPFALALAMAGRESGTDVRAGIGTPKSLVAKLATRFGRELSETGLLIALGRAIGLWDPSAANGVAPPGTLNFGELSRALFETWRGGGAWDEARAEPEVLRLPADARDPSPARVVREVVLEALRDLGEGSWIPWPLLLSFLGDDPHTPGTTRLLRRWAARTGTPTLDVLELAERVVLESLPALGVIDTGLLDSPAHDPGDAVPEPVTAIRLTARGRALIAGNVPPSDGVESRFLDTHVLRVGSDTKAAAVLSLASFADVAKATETLDLLVAPHTLARALGAGLEGEAVRARFEAIAPLPEGLSRTIAQASTVLGRASFAPASAFLWVSDDAIREMLRTRKATADLFVDPSPMGGLLVQPGVDAERLARRARGVGIEIVQDGQVVRARTLPPPRLTPPRGTPST